MRLEQTTFFQLKPGDLFFYPTEEDGAGVQVRTDAQPDEDAGDAQVVRIVCEPGEKP